MTDALIARPAAAPSEDAQRAAVWSELVTRAINLFRVTDFHRVTLELLARSSGRDLAEVRAHFATFDDLLFAVVQVWNAERMKPLLAVAEQAGAVAFLRAVVRSNLADPGLMRLLAATVNVVATGTSPIAPLLQQQWMRFHASVQRTLMHDIELGREPATMDSSRGAEQLIALYEGLQIQAMVRPAMNLLEAYDRATQLVRDGWTHRHDPMLWDI